MATEEQTKTDLLTLIQGRNQRIAELELLILDLNRRLDEKEKRQERQEGQVVAGWVRRKQRLIEKISFSQVCNVHNNIHTS